MGEHFRSAIAHASIMPGAPELTHAEHFEPSFSGLPRSLGELELLVWRDLDLTRYPAKLWVLPRFRPDGQRALDALIVGGGQAGLASAFGLLQQRVTNILVIDENLAGAEGPWGTYARMATLRTQKEVGGIELGVASASFRAWYEVQHGRRAWDALYKIPTELWHQYLQWYRRVIDIPVRNECRLVAFGPGHDGLIKVTVESGGKRETIWTRTLVFATGIEGNGLRHAPAFVTEHLPRERWAHTHDPIDFPSLRDRGVAVLGGAASAFDNAIMAAEHGARAVHIFHREKELQAANPMGWAEFSGYLAHFPDLPLADRWRFTRQLKRFKTGPPVATVGRARALPNIVTHPGCSWSTVAMDGDQIRIAATDGVHAADFVILGTGYMTDMAVRPEFAEHLEKIALWRDVFTPPPGDEDASLAGAPYLGPNFEMLEKSPGAAPWLADVFNFSRGAQMSMGAMPIGLSGIKFGVPRLVHGVTKRLFTVDAELYFEGIKQWQTTDKVAEP
jgi:cation diffusion facilitator CzcD-associated flavoprotein CzcO